MIQKGIPWYHLIWIYFYAYFQSHCHSIFIFNLSQCYNMLRFHLNAKSGWLPYIFFTFLLAITFFTLVICPLHSLIGHKFKIPFSMAIQLRLTSWQNDIFSQNIQSWQRCAFSILSVACIAHQSIVCTI